MKRRMHPRLVIGPKDASNHLAMPARAGAVDIYAWKGAPFLMADREAIEYRTPSGQPIVVVRIAWNATRVLSAISLPVRDEDEDDTGIDGELLAIRQALVSAGVILRAWRVTRERLLDAFEADNTALATAAKAVWPSSWRDYAAGDQLGDPRAGVPAGAPTGPRRIGVRLA